MAKINLDNLKRDLAIDAFGCTKEQAHAKGVCIQCMEPALPRCYSDAGRREYGITAICEYCFDRMFPPDEDDK